jgi:energy-coupling factor transporter ATP-binding protein EcfA2
VAPRELDAWSALWHEAGQVFSPGAPIDESDLFAGRIEQVRDLLDTVYQRGQHAIVFGERGVGKTSLANTFTKFMHSPISQVIAVRVNCDGIDSYSSIWRKALADWGEDVFPEGDFGPFEVRRALGGISLNNVAIIILDEFDRLRNDAAKTLIADTIKDLSDGSVRATVIAVGVADSVGDLLKEHASIGRNLIEVPMPRMKDAELEEIVEKRLARLNMTIAKTVLQRIVKLSQGLPHYTHLLGLHATRAAVDSRTGNITMVHLNAAVVTCLDRAQQSVKEAYHRATSSPRKESLFREVLLACALADTDELGYFTASAVADPMSRIMGKRYEIPSFAQHLKDFCSQQRGPILEQRGTKRRYRYRFRDPLMQPFIIMHGVRAGMRGAG